MSLILSLPGFPKKPRGKDACVAQAQALGSGQQPQASTSPDELQRQRHAAKEILRHKAASCKRGRSANLLQRGDIAEAQVAVEGLAPPLDYESLVGTWRLIYTDAIDVLPILNLPDSKATSVAWPLPLQVGSIFQRFSSVEEGKIQNIIRWGVPFLLDDEGVTLTVNAKYDVRSPRRLQLRFESAEIGDLRISEQLEAVLAPALLPRTSINHQMLLALREFSAKFPFPQQELAPRLEGGSYLLTYLDRDMLIGRALFTGGTYVFDRDDL